MIFVLFQVWPTKLLTVLIYGHRSSRCVMYVDDSTSTTFQDTTATESGGISLAGMRMDLAQAIARRFVKTKMTVKMVLVHISYTPTVTCQRDSNCDCEAVENSLITDANRGAVQARQRSVETVLSFIHETSQDDCEQRGEDQQYAEYTTLTVSSVHLRHRHTKWIHFRILTLSQKTSGIVCVTCSGFRNRRLSRYNAVCAAVLKSFGQCHAW
jgi:hypothetical protein